MEQTTYIIGRGKPPKHTQWKNGQTGNPRRIRGPKSLNAAKMVEKAFRKRIHVTEGEERRRLTIFEAIVLQLWTKAAKGNTRATRVFLQYQDFGAAQGELGGFDVRILYDLEDNENE